MMKKIYISILSGIVLSSLASCAKEDEPVLQYTDPAVTFMPADDATDEISELRRQFFQQTGTYLLFNDTLQHRCIGKDLNGEEVYFTELLDIKYEVGQTSKPSSPYSYTYLNTENCKKALEYLNKFILPHFSERLRPFSWMLINTIKGKVNNEDTYPYAVAGQRGVVLACSELKNLKTDNQKQQLAKRHLLVIVQNLSGKNSASFNDFNLVSEKYYNASYTLDEGQTKADALRSKGFLSSVNAGKYPTKDEDFNSFASLVISYPMSKIETTYAKYPLVVKKAKLFEDVLIQLGYIY